MELIPRRSNLATGTDTVEDIGKESRVAPKLLTVSEKGLTITK